MVTAEKKKGNPPTTVIVTNAVVAERPYMIVRPKLSARLLSIPVETESENGLGG
jgi:hypothetical protein